MADNLVDALPPIATDAFFGGQLSLRQFGKGHRAGTDAILLAAAAPVDFSGLALDVGAGVGAAGLALARARPHVRICLVENDPSMAALARENIILNELASRGFVAQADILSAPSRRDAGLPNESASLVVTNPPFFDPSRARLSPQPEKRRAHAMEEGGAAPLAGWIAASLALLEPGGLFILIHRPDALPGILESLTKRAGGITIMPIHSRPGAPAIRILVRGKKGSHAPASIAPALVLHDGKKFTQAAEAIHRGVMMIDW